MIHLLQLMIHLLDTCPEPEVYPTCKSIVVTDGSFVATAVQCDYQLKKKKMMNNQKKMVMNKKKKKNDDGEEK
ncbi:hypothetical protein H5410_037300 [Solanum commersonii]|uniref:Uncharacterized protein n=1 Tax=Solanum commersonii TaxID=4109 RepID=A0A9J5Y9T7_SOLCO|nr:hypothetical protein H5410_037300 [Solanum commersonii]